jgi:hypothetical protein
MPASEALPLVLLARPPQPRANVRTAVESSLAYFMRAFDPPPTRLRALDGRDIERFEERARRVSSFVGER